MRARGRRPRDVLRLTKAVCVKGLDIPPLETVGDVRGFLRHVPETYRQHGPWQRLEGELDKAEASGKATDLTIALQLVLSMNGLLGRTAE